jgi:hypothetical protein
LQRRRQALAEQRGSGIGQQGFLFGLRCSHVREYSVKMRATVGALGVELKQRHTPTDLFH